MPQGRRALRRIMRKSNAQSNKRHSISQNPHFKWGLLVSWVFYPVRKYKCGGSHAQTALEKQFIYFCRYLDCSHQYEILSECGKGIPGIYKQHTFFFSLDWLEYCVEEDCWRRALAKNFGHSELCLWVCAVFYGEYDCRCKVGQPKSSGLWRLAYVCGGAVHFSGCGSDFCLGGTMAGCLL